MVLGEDRILQEQSCHRATRCMKIKKPIIRHWRESLFDADIVLVVSNYEDFLGHANKMLQEDKKEALKSMVDDKGHDDWCLATQFPFGGGGSIIWAHPSSKMGTIVHEIVHAAHHLLDRRSVPLSEDTEEVYAYLIERMFTGLLS
jgi:hypothetical protein